MTASRMQLIKAIVSIALSGLAAAASAQPINEKISVRELLANPAKFHHKRVLVGGYLRIEFEGSALYRSQDAMKSRRDEEAVWINVLECERVTCTESENRRFELHERRLARYNGEYVYLEGTADKHEHGHFSVYNGGIFNITRVIPEGREAETFLHVPATQVKPIREKVSVRELLANPARFHHKEIVVVGHLWFEPEAKVLVLYQSREALEKRPRADAIWIDVLTCRRITCNGSEIRRSELHQDRLARYLGRHVELEGTASKRGRGLAPHTGKDGRYDAGIFEITRVTTEGWEPETFSH